jgi:hypothetical protein
VHREAAFAFISEVKDLEEESHLLVGGKRSSMMPLTMPCYENLMFDIFM